MSVHYREVSQGTQGIIAQTQVYESYSAADDSKETVLIHTEEQSRILKICISGFQDSLVENRK